MKKVNKKGLIIASGAAIAAFLVIKRLSAKEDGDIVDPKAALRDILGTPAATGEGTTVYNIPAQAAVTFPEMQPYTEVFAQPAIAAPERAAAQRGVGMTPAQRTAYDIMSATAMGGGVYTPPTKKEAISRTFLPIAPAGVAAKGAIQEAAVTEAQRVSRAGVAGGGAITSFLRDVSSFFISTPSRIGAAGAAGGEAIGGAIRGVTGVSKKYDYMGTGMTQSEYKSQFAHRTYGTSPTGEVVKPKKITSYPAELAAQAERAPGATPTSYDPTQG